MYLSSFSFVSSTYSSSSYLFSSFLCSTFSLVRWVIQQFSLPVSLSSQSFPISHFPLVSLLSSFCVTSLQNRCFHLDLSFPVGHYSLFSCWKPLMRFCFIYTIFPYYTILLFINLSSSVIVFKFCDIFISYSLLLFHFMCLKFSSQLLPFYQYVPWSMPMFLPRTLITGI